MKDPNRQELLTAVKQMPFYCELDDFDSEEAIYWFASDWHSGQSSNLYSVLSTSEYRPGPMAHGPEGTALDIYDHFCETFK